ncbi:MAG: putative non-canonical purine NTP phosphatase [Candidatus Gottesmanbacteria bacterium GW2011_GWA1_34_13]|uniref:Probable inosine/xanthosine triphosphatase n=1 Tax=Candidatus Gottesmanbacteria bacterium GW2011_GWA1_34_13 TaxID=1618434 RepID=A0A0G0AQL9_9BACT|nr:MAG: putative non-canonical purine NTP phosphatase [Candidatus Gottesmanbacteria bacterium GW2011_GWA1_34_13]
MKIVIASTNPVKIRAVEEAFKKVFEKDFEIDPVSAKSGVPDQPMSDKETLKGATNRVDNAMKEFPKANYWVGIEGGVEVIDNRLATFAWVVVKSKKQTGKAKSDTFFLPEKVAELVKKGKELGEANDIVFKKHNSKQNNGAVGLLTKDSITRDKLYEDVVVLALIPFIHKGLYK